MPVREEFPGRLDDGPAKVDATPVTTSRSSRGDTTALTGFTDLRTVHRGELFEHLLARENGTGREVVVKRAADAGHRWVSTVLDQQARLLARVGTHPNIVTLLRHVTMRDGRTALVLEHLPRTAADLLAAGRPLAAPTVAAFGIQLAGALETVRSAGAVHAAVRPGVVRLNAWDEPVLGGFDDAVLTDPHLPSYPVLHESGAYTAPELLFGQEATPRADVYGLGAVLYELLSGHGAFRGYAGESPAAIIARSLTDHTRRVRLPGVPLDLADLVTWTLAGDPRDRPPGPAWVAEELSRIQHAQGWPHTPIRAA